jgi:hypothetical protein
MARIASCVEVLKSYIKDFMRLEATEAEEYSELLLETLL